MRKVGLIEANLEPCPFCESPAVLENYVLEAVARCTASFCGASIKRKHAPREDTGIDQARQAWNRRPGQW